MKLIIFLLSISSWSIVNVVTETCSQPEVMKDQFHIYRSADVNVTVYHCYYQHRYPYSDITKNCINSFKTRLYIDKWKETNYVDVANPPIRLMKYTTNANIMQNEITLKSGAVCRYDRGFCYDTRESTHFAAVWEVSNEKQTTHAQDLIQIFYGWIDTWEFRNNGAKFLVFQDNGTDRSFALQLMNQSKLDDKDFWYTDRYGIIVSKMGLKDLRSVPILNQKYFPLRPKQFVSDQVLTKCDLQKFPLDFEKDTYQNHILNPNNLVDILAIFQNQLLEIKKKCTNKENPAINKAVDELQKDMRGVKASLLAKDKEILETRGTIQSTLDALSKKDVDVSTLQELMKETLVKQQSKDAELDEIIEKLTIVQNQLSKLNDYPNRKEIHGNISKLENNLALLETTLLKQIREIYNILYNKDELTEDIKNSLNDIYTKIQNKDIELKKEQGNVSNQLLDIKRNLNRQNNEIMKCQNYTNQALAQKHTEINKNVKGQRATLEVKYNSLLAKINLHDVEINKCRNYTTLLISNKDRSLEVIEDGVRKTQHTVLGLEGKVQDLLNRDKLLETNLYEIGEITSKLKDNITHGHEEFINEVNKNNIEVKKIKEKSEQCQRVIDTIIKSKNEGSEEVGRNITYMRQVLVKQDQDILELLGILKGLNDKSNANYENFTEAIRNCKHSVNIRLLAKDEEIKNIQENLRKKDGEIEKLHEHLKKMDEKIKDSENKINRCQEDTDRQLKEKGEEIKHIQDNLKLRDKEFREELNKRDREYKKLEAEIKRIKEELQTVPAV